MLTKKESSVILIKLSRERGHKKRKTQKKLKEKRKKLLTTSGRCVILKFLSPLLGAGSVPCKLNNVSERKHQKKGLQSCTKCNYKNSF